MVSRSLRKSCRRYEIRFGTAFEEVIAACADPSRRGAWIDRRMKTAYMRLHELGWAHSVEAWSADGRARRRPVRGGHRGSVRRRVDVLPPDATRRRLLSWPWSKPSGRGVASCSTCSG